MMVSHRVFHPVCQGQCAGRCRVGLRAGAAKRAGTVTRSRRRVVAARGGVLAADKRASGAQPMVRHHRAAQPRAVRGEQPLPGFGSLLGAELLAAADGDLTTFNTADRLVGLAGLAPVPRDS